MALQQALHKRVTRLQKRLQHLQRDAGTVNVHRFRIACRELLACHELLHDLAPEKHWQPRVKKALHSLGRLRDLQQMRDQLLERRILTANKVEEAFAAPLRKALTRWEKYVPELQASVFRKTLAQLEQALRNKSLRTDELQVAWQTQWTRSLRRVSSALYALNAADHESLHRLRIRYKQLRYLLELQLDSGMKLPVTTARLSQWQDEFGRAVDCRVMARYAGKLQLPERLQRQYLRQAERHLQKCITKRAAFATLLARLERDVAKQLPVTGAQRSR